MKELLLEVRAMGHDSVRIVGDGDIGEICRLTCLEEGVRIECDPVLPTLEVHGWNVSLENCPNND